MNEHVLVLRTCNENMKSYFNSFQWPKSGHVKAPDWLPTKKCGNGLHGFLWGEGDGSLANWSPSANWLVVRVNSNQIINLGDKVKFPEGEVVLYGDRKGATDYLASNGGVGKAIIGYHATAGDFGTATAGDQGTATAGYRGTATAGYRGTASAGYGGTATAGDDGNATAGDYGHATAGDNGTATAGYRGTATAGYRGTATAGEFGTATAGDYGILQIKWYDRNRYRIAIAYVGEKSILPNTTYKLNEQGQFEKA